MNWSAFDDFPTPMCGCACGAEFRSHAQFNKELDGMVSRLSCPKCGKNNAIRFVRSEPEVMTVGVRDISEIGI